MRKSRLIRIGIILAVAGFLYWKQERNASDSSSGEKGSAAVLKENPLAGSQIVAEKVRGYDKFRNARLVADEGNDGDSFYVDLGGRKVQLRLYFVDAPEKYLSDRYENQQRRVAEQAS